MSKRRQLRSVFCGVVLLCIAVSGPGCRASSGAPEYPGNAGEQLDGLRSTYFLADVYEIYRGLGTEDERRQYRDAVIGGRLEAIDIVYDTFRREISLEKNRVNVGSDAAAIGLGAAGAVVQVTGTQAILAAIQATVTGTQASINENLFYDQALPALTAQMDASRSEVLVRIRRGLRQPTSGYSISEGISDLGAYYHAGTIVGAVAAITENAGETGAKANQQLNSISETAYDLSGPLRPLRDRVSDWLLQDPQSRVPTATAWLTGVKGVQGITVTNWVDAASTSRADLEEMVAHFSIP